MNMGMMLERGRGIFGRAGGRFWGLEPPSPSVTMATTAGGSPKAGSAEQNSMRARDAACSLTSFTMRGALRGSCRGNPARVAQMAEQLSCKQQVRSSILLSGSLRCTPIPLQYQGFSAMVRVRFSTGSRLESHHVPRNLTDVSPFGARTEER